MIKSVITAKFDLCGTVKIEFPIDITDHHAREILDAVAEVMTDKYSNGKITRTEKDENNLTRKAETDPSQQTIFVDDPKKQEPKVIEADYQIVGETQKQLPAPDGAPDPLGDLDTSDSDEEGGDE